MTIRGPIHPFNPSDRSALNQRAKDLVRARERARRESEEIRRSLPSRLRLLLETAAAAGSALALLGSVATGDPWSIWAAISALSTVINTPLTSYSLWQHREKLLRLRDLEIEITECTRALALIADALKRL